MLGRSGDLVSTVVCTLIAVRSSYKYGYLHIGASKSCGRDSFSRQQEHHRHHKTVTACTYDPSSGLNFEKPALKKPRPEALTSVALPSRRRHRSTGCGASSR